MSAHEQAIDEEFSTALQQLLPGDWKSLIDTLKGVTDDRLKQPLEILAYNSQGISTTMPVAAQAYKVSIGHPIMYPKNVYSYTQNFLNMMFALPTAEYELDPVVDDALNKLLILHADHEQNCSTSTVRIVGSSKASIYSSISAGINALWGPLHGGKDQI